MDFKVGDRVKVVRISNEDDVFDVEPMYLIGKTGTVVTIERSKYMPLDDTDCPYQIKFDDDISQESGNLYWEERELELIEAINETKMTGRKKFNLIFANMTNESLADLFLGGSCPSEFGLFDKKETGCPDFICTTCWEKALDMEYEQ